MGKEGLVRRALKNRAVRLTAGGILAAAGFTAYADALNQFTPLHEKPKAIERRLAGDFPGYSHKGFEGAQGIIVDFSKKTEDLIVKGNKTIEVPEDVAQAVNVVHAFSGAEKTYIKKAKGNFFKNLAEGLGGAVGIGAGITLFISKRVLKKRYR